MTKTTPSPRIDVLEGLPELSEQAITTIRMHPRQGEVPDAAGSKIGGHFLWPADEVLQMIPILQINKVDVPEFPFLDGTDLFQLFWESGVTGDPYDINSYKMYWRLTASVTDPVDKMPNFQLSDMSFVPTPCTLTFESVEQYPHIDTLNVAEDKQLHNWLIEQVRRGIINVDDYAEEFDDESTVMYLFELSTCPDSKLGGYPHWIQDSQVPTCTNGHVMKHLLTLTDFGIDAATWIRWLPIEDWVLWQEPTRRESITNAPGWRLGTGSMYYFICRQCQDWQTEVVYQR